MADARRAPLKDQTDVSGAHALIVEARFYDDIQDALLQGAVAELKAAGVTHEVITVPGSLEIPAAIAIALFFDAFLDPIVGQFSDNLRTRWGRRHPLMYASALPVAVSYLLLWNPPHWSHEALFVYLVVVAVVVRTFITFYEIPSSALAPELSDDYDQRTSFLSYRLFFAWYGGLTMLALAFVVDNLSLTRIDHIAGAGIGHGWRVSVVNQPPI